MLRRKNGGGLGGLGRWPPRSTWIIAAEDENETNENQVEYSIGMDMIKEGVQTRKDEQGDPKKVCEWIGWGCNKFWISLASPVGKVRIHVAYFVG